MLEGQDPTEMTPWYRGFLGCFSWESATSTYKVATKFDNSNSHQIQGKWKRVSKDTLEITELPIGRWTQPYVTFLESLMSPS